MQSTGKKENIATRKERKKATKKLAKENAPKRHCVGDFAAKAKIIEKQSKAKGLRSTKQKRKSAA